MVTDGTAARCDQSTCICSSHDNYHRIVAQRLADAEAALNSVADSEEQGEQQQTIEPTNEPYTDISADEEEEADDNNVEASRWDMGADLETMNTQAVELQTYEATNLYMLCRVGEDLRAERTMISMAQYKKICIEQNTECECDDSNLYAFGDDVVMIQAPSERVASTENEWTSTGSKQDSFGSSSDHATLFAIVALIMLTILCLVMLVICCKLQ